ncbi:MAG: hypothetical protein KIT36_22560 [Alphaproteobacteria bacterium]|nr:hypothetical protein [Alphaproteobacteria bacterium]
MRRLIIAFSLLTLVGAAAFPTVMVSDANAQATCRAKCTDEEQACLKRTGNKGQCGDKATQCLAKCK